jgi:hypothetical protein
MPLEFGGETCDQRGVPGPHGRIFVLLRDFILTEDVMTVEKYNEFFVGQVSTAIAEACEKLGPGSTAWGLG